MGPASEDDRRRAEAVDALIMEMVTGPTEQVAPCIRNALERGWEQPLPGALQDFQQRRREEIERVCSRYYAEFLGSVQELLKAKSRSAALRQQIVRFNDDIKNTGQETLKTGNELQKQKATRRNINAAIVILTQCRELTSLMATAKQQIEDSRYYPALRTVDSISHQLSTAYDQPFIQRVNRWLPELSNQIKAAALRDVAQWLVVIRSKSVSIGKGALRKCVNYMTGQGSAGSLAEGSSGSALTPVKQLIQQIQNVINFTAWTDEEELQKNLPAFLRTADGEDNQIFSTLHENLDPLHRALYIHAHLGALDELHTYYVNNRLPQATLPSTASPAATVDEWVLQFQEALAYTAGVFVTEHTTLKATEFSEGLLSTAKLEETWWVIQRDLCSQLEAKAPQLTSPAHFIQLKQTAVLLAFTLGEDCFRFNTQPLIDQIRTLRDRYQTVQLRSIESICTQILQDEVYQPISIQSEKEYRALILPFGIDKQQDASSEALLSEEIVEPMSPSLAGRRLTEESIGVIIRLLNRELTSGIQADANFPISKACQISVDGVTLAKMTNDFEKMLQYSAARFYSTEGASKVPEIMQNAKREFENVSISAQHVIFELIQRKIDELLGGMCFIEWEASSLQSRPRSYADDVISYLQVTFMCLTYLPKMAREGIHFASCSHINTIMMDTLLDSKNVKSVNTNGLYNLNVDVAALEAFADSCGIMQLRECFAELRQTLGCMLHRDINTIMLDASLREGVYPKIHTAKLVSILERYKPLGVFSQVKNMQRTDTGGTADLPYLDKKKVAEYIKALKHQMM